MRKFLILAVLIFAGINLCFAADDIFYHPSTGKQVSKLMPKLTNATCKFEQEKYFGNTVLKLRNLLKKFLIKKLMNI